MDKILISVIVPVYNAEQYLKRCIDSLRQQTLVSLEIILVDDGSTDQSGAMCDKYAALDIRIRVLHKKNEGTMYAWIDGVRMAQGEYIGFVDSDDWIVPEMYSKLYERIEDASGDIIACGCIRKEKRKEKNFFNIEKDEVYQKEEIYQTVISDLFANIRYGNARWNKLFKRELILNNLKYCKEKIIVGEDLYIVFACTLDSRKIVYFPEKLYYYCENESSVTSTFKKNYLTDALVLYRKLKMLIKIKKVNIEKRLSIFYSKMLLHNILSVARLPISRQEKCKMIKKYFESKQIKDDFVFELEKIDRKEKFALFCLKNKCYCLLVFFITLDVWRKRVKKSLHLFT